MSKVLHSSLLTLDPSELSVAANTASTARRYCGHAADTEAKASDTRVSVIANLCDNLTQSLRRPTSRTLTLIEKALHLLHPFESPKASVASPSERHDLLTLLTTHRDILCPYINTDRIELNLKISR